MSTDLEEGPELQLDFTKLERVAGSHVIPCADVTTMEVVLVAYVNEEALRRAVETRSAVFWSTLRYALWEKGKSSGESFDLVDVLVNCEQNSLVYRVSPVVPASATPRTPAVDSATATTDASTPTVEPRAPRPVAAWKSPRLPSATSSPTTGPHQHHCS